jgi:putative addiction module component (TIGR02574 family)
MLVESHIQNMSRVERLQAMELIWRSLSESANDLESPAWHGAVLSERLEKVEAGEGKFLTIPELKTRLTSGRG